MSNPQDNLRSLSGISQIRGTTVNGSTGMGIPKQVTNVGLNMGNAQAGSTSTLTVTFQRDPTDNAFGGVTIWVKGYQSNPSPIQVASSTSSPVTFVLNNTGESVSLIVQAYGNGGAAPLTSSPTTGLTLPKSSGGGVGTTTVVSPPAVSGTATAGQLAKFASPATTLTGADLTGDVVTSGSVATTVQKVQGVSVSTNTPVAGDALVYNPFSDSKWDVTSLWANQHVAEFYVYGNATALVSTGINTGVSSISAFTTNGGSTANVVPSATEPALIRLTNTATSSPNSAGWVFQSSGAINYWTLGTIRRFSCLLRLRQTSNVRYWFGLIYSATGQAGSTPYVSDTPNGNYIAFRYSSTTDSTIKCVCATDNTHQTVADSTVSVDTTNLVLFEITWDGTNANFFINGTRRAQVSTNVPATSQGLGIGFLTDNKSTNNAGAFDLAHCTISML